MTGEAPRAHDAEFDLEAATLGGPFKGSWFLAVSNGVYASFYEMVLILTALLFCVYVTAPGFRKFPYRRYIASLREGLYGPLFWALFDF